MFIHKLNIPKFLLLAKTSMNLVVRSPVSCMGYGGGLVAKSCPTLSTIWTVAPQASLSVGFSRQEYWSGLPFPSPDLPDSEITKSPISPALAGRFFITESPGKPRSWKG